MMDAKGKIIVALDMSDSAKAEYFVESLLPYVKLFKIGLELCTAIGEPQAVKLVQDKGGEVFLDAKLNDIPDTVARASKNIARLGVKMFSIHASSGFEAMQKAVANKGQSLVLAVTVLTSLGDEDSICFFNAHRHEIVPGFIGHARVCGVDGVICSTDDLPLITECKRSDNLIKVVPGIRPKWALTDDQKCFATPAAAIEKGADYLVIGRPIIRPPMSIGNHVNAVQLILEEITQALNLKKSQGR